MLCVKDTKMVALKEFTVCWIRLFFFFWDFISQYRDPGWNPQSRPVWSQIYSDPPSSTSRLLNLYGMCHHSQHRSDILRTITISCIFDQTILWTNCWVIQRVVSRKAASGAWEMDQQVRASGMQEKNLRSGCQHCVISWVWGCSCQHLGTPELRAIAVNL